MSWWAGIPVTGHVCQSTEVFRFESNCGQFKDDPLPDGSQCNCRRKPVVLADRGACSTTRARMFWVAVNGLGNEPYKGCYNSPALFRQ